jgi:hypothetical protein
MAPGYPVPGSLGGLPCVPSRHQERIFPLMLALNAPDLFSYRSCNFKVRTVAAAARADSSKRGWGGDRQAHAWLGGRLWGTCQKGDNPC